MTEESHYDYLIRESISTFLQISQLIASTDLSSLSMDLGSADLTHQVFQTHGGGADLLDAINTVLQLSHQRCQKHTSCF